MAIPTPKLDNISFDDFVAEAKSLIPVYAPQWTNFNPSDPGITFIELFAWLCEMINYRIDQIPDENYESFIKLLGIKLDEGEELESGIRRAVYQFQQCHRAVTATDFEYLAKIGLLEKTDILEKYPDLEVRTICFTNRDLENYKTEEAEQSGHISVVLVAKTQNSSELMKDKEKIRGYVKQYLYDRKLLTTRIHVVDPDYQEIKISMQVAANDDGVVALVRKAIERFLDPIYGGDDGLGWPPGRSLYSSDLYYLVEGIAGVDHVVRIELDATTIKPYQLIRLNELTIEVES